MISRVVQSTIETNQLDKKSFESNQTNWIKKWVVKFHHLLINHQLNAIYHDMLNDKITAKSDENHYFNISFFKDESTFLYELFLIANHYYQWISEEELENINLESKMEVALKNDNIKDATYLLNQYEKFVTSWLNDQIAGCQNKDKETFYIHIFQVFFKAYTLGMIDDKNDKNQINKLIHEDNNEAYVKQDNHHIFHQIIKNYCFKYQFLQNEYELFEYNNAIQTYLQKTSENTLAFKRLNALFNSFIWSFITNKNVEKITIEFAKDNIDKESRATILNVINKNKFNRIQVMQNNNLVFIYDKKNGITNHEWLNEVDYDEAIVLWQLSLIGQSQPSKTSHFYSPLEFSIRQTSHHLYQLAQKSTQDLTDEICLDSSIPFSMLGQMGIRQFLYQLDHQYGTDLSKEKISKPYTLYIPQKSIQTDPLPLATLIGFADYLKSKINIERAKMLCFQHLVINIHFHDQKNTNDVINHFCDLLLLLDRLKLKQLTVHVIHIESKDYSKIANTLKNIAFTLVHFTGSLSQNDILYFDEINERQLQMAVPEAFAEDRVIESKLRSIAAQPSPITLVKINNILNQEVELQPVRGKLSIQNQYHYQQSFNQQSEVTIQQSWQIEENQQVKQEIKTDFHIFNAKDEDQLISWFDILAAMDVHNSHHETAKKKLGDEILSYSFKNRNLIDLWNRLTGDISVTQQDIPPEKSIMADAGVPFYSRYVPKRIAKNLLLLIVRNPHSFQDGFTLNALQPDIGYDSSLGALFIDTNKYFKNSEPPSPFSQSILTIQPVKQPIAAYFNILTNSHLPSSLFFTKLISHVSEYHAWQTYRFCFSPLNIFNDDGIFEINSLIQELLKMNESSKVEILKYFSHILRFYHYKKMIFNNDRLSNSQIEFDLNMNEAYQKGDLNVLSPQEMNNITIDWRKKIHLSLVDIMNNNAYKAIHDAKQQKILFDLLDQLLPHEVVECIDRPIFHYILTSLNTANLFKLIELVASSHLSVTKNICFTLSSIYQAWGEIGLKDFEYAFITPRINLSDLANPFQQKMIAQLLTLTPTQYHWWQQLTLQHAEQSGFSDIAELMQAYQAFLDELETMQLKNALMLPCPLQGISNLQVGLNRVLTVLKCIKKPFEQFQQLQGLDWSACGAVLAAQENQFFQFVTANMKLNIIEEKAIQQFISNGYHVYRQFYHYNIELFSKASLKEKNSVNKQHLFAISLTLFYRFISSKKYTAPMQVYQQYLDALQLPNEYLIHYKNIGVHYIDGKLVSNLTTIDHANEVILSSLLKIIAFGTTGPRALNRLPIITKERVNQLIHLIHALYESARSHSYNPEMDQLYQSKYAVDYEYLLESFDDLYDLCGHHNYLDQEDEVGTTPRLDLAEMTTILHLIKRSDDFYYQILIEEEKHNRNIKDIKDHKHFFYDLSQSFGKISTWEFQDIFGRKNNQGLFTNQLLRKYKQYFIDVISRLQQFNLKSDYASFLLLSLNLENSTLSHENKGQLLRLLSLVEFNIHHLLADAEILASFFTKLQQYQHQFGLTAHDVFIHSLSKIIPVTNGHFSIAQLNDVIEKCLHKPVFNLPDKLQDFIHMYFHGYKIDESLSEVEDNDFYSSPQSLEQKYKGLGIFYLSIKEIVLKRYKAIDNKKDTWNNFLALIHQLEQPTLQQTTLKAILQTEHPGVTLSVFNEWLRIILQTNKNHISINPSYITALSSKLIQHESNNQFINMTNNWFKYASFYLKERDHLTFIQVLNYLAENKEWIFALEEIDETLRYFHHLTFPDSTHWGQAFIYLLSVLNQQKILRIDLINIFKSINYMFKSEFNNKNLNTKFSNQFLPLLLKNIGHTWSFLLSIYNGCDHNNPERMLQIMLVLSHADLNFENLYTYLKNLSATELTTLSTCYQHTPIPTTILLDALLNDNITLDQFISKHTRDPHGERTEAKLAQQFDDNMLWPYLNRVKYLDEDEDQDKQFNLKVKIVTQLKLINRLGYETFRYLSLADLRDRFHECRSLMFKSPDQNEQLVIKLTTISLIREIIYKICKLWPTPVQMLALLHSLNHGMTCDDPLFVQMATGEGKSLFALMQSLLQWIHGRGVAIVMHRASHAVRDANKFDNVFKRLHIEAMPLTVESYRYKKLFDHLSPKQKKSVAHENQDGTHFDGIYYVEFNTLGLILQIHRLDEGRDLSLYFIIDEADDLLHNQTENNLTQGTNHHHEHVHAWVFEILAGFLKKYATSETLTVKITDLVDYLLQHHPQAHRACQQYDFLSKLSSYLESAWLAATLKEKIDFIPKKLSDKSSDYYAAVMINGKAMDSNVTYGRTQLALHGLLNFQAKEQQLAINFPIAPETPLYSILSPNAMWQRMIKTGSVICMSATTGPLSERVAMREHYQFKFIKLPKMHRGNRLDYPEEFCKNKKAQLKRIAEICHHYTIDRPQSKSRSILITADNIDFIKEIKNYLINYSNQFNPSELHAGIQVTDETMSELEHQAGRSGHILIAINGLIERGFDIKLSTATQVVVIATDLTDQDTEYQKKGRAGRMNSKSLHRDKGKFYGIYDFETELKRYPLRKLSKDVISHNSELFKQIQYHHYYKQTSYSRLRSQLISISKDTIQSHFDMFWIMLTNKKLLSVDREEILNLYTSVINKIVNVVPPNGFTENNATGMMLRKQYNQHILTMYLEYYEKMQTLLGMIDKDHLHHQRNEMNERMELSQQQFLMIHAKALKIKSYQPKHKIHQKWKPHLNNNMYIDPGKQGWVNYLTNQINVSLLAKATQNEIAMAKTHEKNKRYDKGKMKHYFLTQLELAMNITSDKHFLEENYQTIYKQLFEVKNNILLRNSDKKSSLLKDSHYEMIKKWDSNNTIKFVYDPLAGKSMQIILTGSFIKYFKKLQEAIDHTHDKIGKSTPIQFRVSKVNDSNPPQYQVIIDFSSHAFDSCDKKMWFTSIATEMDIDVSYLFPIKHVPPIHTMKTVLNELIQQAQSTKTMPKDLYKYLSNINLHKIRMDYYTNIYSKIISLFLQSGYECNERINILLEAITQAECNIEYINRKGQLCISPPPIFNSLQDAMNQHKKSQIIIHIEKQLNLPSNRVFSQLLLYKYQVDYLRQLCEMMAINHQDSAEDIFRKFEQQTFVFNNEEKTFFEIMNLRTSKQSYYIYNLQSPDLSGLYYKIQDILGILHSTPYQLKDSQKIIKF